MIWPLNNGIKAINDENLPERVEAWKKDGHNQEQAAIRAWAGVAAEAVVTQHTPRGASTALALPEHCPGVSLACP